MHYKIFADDLFYIDPHKRLAWLDDELLALSSKEFDLLYCITQHAGEVLSIDDLLDCVWGIEWVGETQTVYVHIYRLRKKIERDPTNPQHLLSVYGTGYTFVPAVGMKPRSS